jgi:hypothetical protein
VTSKEADMRYVRLDEGELSRLAAPYLPRLVTSYC